MANPLQLPATQGLLERVSSAFAVIAPGYWEIISLFLCVAAPRQMERIALGVGFWIGHKITSKDLDSFWLKLQPKT